MCFIHDKVHYPEYKYFPIKACRGLTNIFQQEAINGKYFPKSEKKANERSY
jgi:hypothetical protein